MGQDPRIPENTKAAMLLACIDPNCALESAAAALRAQNVSELTWESVATALIDEYNARRTSTSTSLIPNYGSRKDDDKQFQIADHSHLENESESPNVENTLPALVLAMQRSKLHTPKLYCGFCERSGHTSDRCIINRDHQNNRVPPGLKKAPSCKSVKGFRKFTTELGKVNKFKFEYVRSIEESTSVSPPSDARTYADSGTTVHCFHSIHEFTPGSLPRCARGIVTLANSSGAQSETCGEVQLEFESSIIEPSNVLLIPELG